MGRLGVGIAAGFAVAACIMASAMVGKRVKRRRKWKKMVKVLEELEESCGTPVGRLKQVVDAMAVEMHAGLASEGGSKLKMLLTYVDKLPNGREKGTYYALHLGGTNFRVLRVHLGDQRSAILGQDIERQPIPQHLMTSTSEDLLDFVASSLKNFIEKEGDGLELPSPRRRELGFTFSFPVKQTSVSSGILIKWTKGFAIEDMIGRDVSECLQQAIARKGHDVRVAALINDTVGTLALGHYNDEDTVAAVVIGTGTNACYLERADAIIKCQGLLTTSGSMVVNMEWGNFWSSHLPRTSYDIDLDVASPNPNDQVKFLSFGHSAASITSWILLQGFEKMISGLYLGDIVRRVLLRMSQESDDFGPASSKLAVPFALRTPLMAAMHEDDSPDLSEVAKILGEVLELPDVPVTVRKLVVKVCDVITRRAARLAAAGIVGILKKIGRDGNGGIAGGKFRSDRPSRMRRTAAGIVGILKKIGRDGNGGIAGGKFRSDRPSRMRRTVVAIEGGLYTSYTLFREYLNEAMKEILGEEISSNVILRVMEDGSGIGAALLAAANSASEVDRIQLQ